MIVIIIINFSYCSYFVVVFVADEDDNNDVDYND